MFGMISNKHQFFSPKKKFNYKITKPKEISMGVFASKLIVFDNKKNIIYNSNKTYISWLPPFDSFKNLIWLSDSDFCFFIEYHRNKNVACVLNLITSEIYMKQLSSSFSFSELFKNEVFKSTHIDSNILNSNDFEKKENKTKKINKLLFSLFWHPRTS